MRRISLRELTAVILFILKIVPPHSVFVVLERFAGNGAQFDLLPFFIEI